MTKQEYESIKRFTKDLTYDAVMYFTGSPLSATHKAQLDINFENKFDEYLSESKTDDLIKIVSGLLGSVDVNITSEWGYRCKWCGRDYTFSENGEQQWFCENDNCPGFKARKAVKNTDRED